ncbi:hypothetical protein FRB99_004476 [Tulasnella sp. 403]|nr:hypothetical protein FRB99_004476 [Tulasnella sp. 403]
MNDTLSNTHTDEMDVDTDIIAEALPVVVTQAIIFFKLFLVLYGVLSRLVQIVTFILSALFTVVAFLVSLNKLLRMFPALRVGALYTTEFIHAQALEMITKLPVEPVLL